MDYIIFDIESNGLLYEDRGIPVANKIWCFCASKFTNGLQENISIVDYAEMRLYIEQHKHTHTFVGHNIKRFDIPMLEKFLGVDLSGTDQIDTLGLSWYLYPKRLEHGLEYWGEDLGIAKPVIDDWEQLNIETYLIRCQKDVEINTKLFHIQMQYLMVLYVDPQLAKRFVKYLMFKLDCAREQEENPWLLDIELCKSNLATLQKELEEKKIELSKVMPPDIKYTAKERPKKCFLKDGTTPSKLGEAWFALLREHDLPDYHTGAVKVVSETKVGNPGSHIQIKNWLFSLGWEPDYYKQVKNKETGEVREIPQITNQDGNDISESVKDLYEIEPNLKHLEGYYVIKHRIGLLEGFLENVNSDGYIKAQIKGFTNTLRFQHTTLVNLPTIPKPYWEMVRGCLVVEEGYELCGSDMSSLEDNTKQHYMYYFDPEYVRIMRTPGFDPHIYMAFNAQAVSWEEAEFVKWYNQKKDGIAYNYLEPAANIDRFAHHALDKAYSYQQLISLPSDEQDKLMKIFKPIRLKNKKVNFAAVYGAGPPKLAITAGVPLPQARGMHTTYWIVNKAVKDVAENTIVKTISNQMWLYNPVSRFWYSLRELKDRFSTLNQGTGVYCFDTWLSHVRRQGIKLTAQFHDEKVSKVKIEPRHREVHSLKLREAIKLTNEQVNLNVPLNISIDFGRSYAEIH